MTFLPKCNLTVLGSKQLPPFLILFFLFPCLFRFQLAAVILFELGLKVIETRAKS